MKVNPVKPKELEGMRGLSLRSVLKLEAIDCFINEVVEGLRRLKLEAMIPS